ncbi:unnamed protein product [marine sediment metagenome]|uniref:Uncharacterized protein n=1 Tax=marine sediment metagenome TaxID=412755 RepID=X1F9J5_9ZZZZ
MSVIDQDVLRVTMNFELGDGTQYQNIFHYIRDGDDPVSDAVHVTTIEIHQEAIYATIVAQVDDNTTVQLCSVDRVAFNEITDQWEVVENIGTFTPAFTPTGDGESIPYMSAPYVIFKTQRPRSVGKKFLFPFIESQQADTVLEAAAVTAMAAYGTACLAAPSLGGDATLTLGITRTGINTFLNFLVAVVNDIIGSQKRRRPGVGA